MAPPPDDLRDRALAAARAAAEARGWPWLDPVAVTSGVAGGDRVWVVRTNAAARGRAVRVTVRAADLAVLEATFLPR